MAGNTHVSILECLINDTEKRIDIYVEKSDKFIWQKSLTYMPLFAIKEIIYIGKVAAKSQVWP